MTTLIPRGNNTGRPNARSRPLAAGRRLLGTLGAVLLAAGASLAQVVTIPAANTNGTGAGTTPARKPLTSFFGFERSAQIYLASELGAAGSITSVAYYLQTNNTTPVAIPVKVYIKHRTTATFAATSTVATEETGATLVYNATITASSFVTGTWITLPLSGAFAYNGTDNLEVIVETNYGGSGGSGETNKRYRYTDLGSGVNRHQTWQQDTSAPTGSGTLAQYRPNVQLAISSSPCTAPPTAGSTQASPASGCTPVSSTLSLSGSATGTGLTYQWQSSPTGLAGSYSNIINATGSTYAASGLTSTTYYQAIVTCSGQSATSTPTTVTISAPVYAAVPYTQGFESSWLSTCNTNDQPDPSWSNTPATGNQSWRRDDQGTSAAWSSTSGVFSPTGSNANGASSSHAARFHSWNAPASSTGQLDLYVNMTGGSGTPILSFDYTQAGGPDKLDVLVSNDGGNTFGAPIFTQAAAVGWNSYSVTLPTTGPNAISATTVIRFRGTSDDGTSDIGLDNVSVRYISCPAPTALSATNLSYNAATLNWTVSGGGVSSGTGTFTVQYGATGFDPNTAGTTLSNLSGTSTAISGLSASTTYQFYVTQNCGGADGSSLRTGPISFTTPVSCPAPTNLLGTPTSNTTAQLTWTVAGGGGSYNVEYGVTGFTPGTGTILTGLTTPSVNISGLSDGTTYQFYVTQNCNGSSTGTGLSTVTGPSAFSTPAVASAPAFAVTRATGVAYSSIVGQTGTQSLSFVSGSSTDDNVSGAVTFGAGGVPAFNFTYLGVAVPGFKVSTNGWVTLDPSINPSGGDNYNNGLGNNSGGRSKMIAPFWEDLVTQGNPAANSGTTAQINASLANSMKYQISGTAGSQVLTVEWIGMERFGYPGPNLNFQAKFYEATGVIEFVYGIMSGFDGTGGSNSSSVYTASVGLNGAAATIAGGNYLAQQVQNTTLNNSNYASNFFLNANAATNSTGANALSVVPTSNSRVTFTPGAFSGGSAPVASAPTNDEPSAPVALSLGVSQPVDFINVYSSANATASAGAPTCSAATAGTADDDVWFTFNVAATSDVTVTARGAFGYDPVVQVLSGTPGSFTALGCANIGAVSGVTTGAKDDVVLNALAPGTYYVRVYDAGTGSGANGAFALEAYATPLPPANDNCAGAITLAANSNCSGLPVRTTIGATPSGQAACTGNPDDDVWFSFVAIAANQDVTITPVANMGTTSFRGAVELFSSTSNDCSNQTSGGCLAATGNGQPLAVSLTNLTLGNTYFLRVYNFSAGSNSGNFTICVSTQCVVPTAVTATSVTHNSANLNFTGGVGATSYAIEYGPTGFTLGTGTVIPNATSGTANAVTGLTPTTAYQFYVIQTCQPGQTTTAGPVAFTTLAACGVPTAVSSNTVTYNSANVTFTAGNGNTSYTVTATPAVGPAVTNSGATSPIALSGLAPLTQYSVVVTGNCAGGLTAASSTYSFTTAGVPPANDNCASATALTVQVGTCSAATTGTNQYATSSAGVVAPGCASYSGNDVWYSIVVPANGMVTVETSAVAGSSLLDTGLALYSGACGSLALIECDDDDGTDAFSIITRTGLTPGSTIYARVWEFGNDVVGSFNICVTTKPDLTVSNGQNLTSTGEYGNITVQNGGTLTFAGNTTAYGAVTVQAGGTLITNCNLLDGSASFTVAAGAELQICAANGIRATATNGAIRNTGTRSFSNDANYVYNGTAAQTTGDGLPAIVRNLTVNNTSGVTLTNAVSIRQVARLQSGNLATGGNAFTLLSGPSGTALVDNTGGVVTGTGTMQRAITGGAALGYRHYSAPVSNTTLADLATSGFVPELSQAAVYNSSLFPGRVTPYPNIFAYDQALIATANNSLPAFDKAWLAPAGTSTPMAVNRGYTVNIGSAALVDFVGTFNNSGQASGSLSRGFNPQAGWQLLGNPYPSPLDWSTVGAAQRPGMDAAMYVYESTGQYAGNYRSYTNGVGASPLIDAGQGYFTRVGTAGGTGSVNLTNANRVTTFDAQPTFGRGANDLRPQLHLTVAGAGQGGDGTYVYFEAGASTGLDADYDATKLSNPTGWNLGSLVGSQELAINGLPTLAGSLDVIVPLSLRVPQAGSFTFEAADLANFGSATVYLRDSQTGTQQLLTAGSRYSFTLASATTPSTRFALVFRPGSVTGTRGGLQAAQVTVYPNPAHHSFSLSIPVALTGKTISAGLYNSLGQLVQQRVLPVTATGVQAQFDVQGLATGVYLLRLDTGSDQLTKRIVVE
jgi:hypothetical protein